ncbi:MAG: hypothetical protein JWN80_893 [Microbacteriaceae bacterium]|jgi:hypothetical protein|nr:hypothetical protein [Microbacteriaceae bacterium]
MPQPKDRATARLAALIDAADGPPPSFPTVATTTFSYDAALDILAMLAVGDVERALRVGAVLLDLQEPDGRFRNAYRSGRALDAGTATGNQAWVGIALMRLGEASGASRYRFAAESAGEWIAESQLSRLGYAGGIDAAGNSFGWKATEHNADAFGLFVGLGWNQLADSAEAFVASMFTGDHFVTGTTDDGATPNPRPIPLDAQTWPALAVGRRYSRALEWAQTELRVDGGVSYSDADTSAVWLEGTAQLALACDDAALLDRVWASQLPDGGVPAASRAGLATGFGETLPDVEHTAATAWAILAATGTNPLAR